MLTVAFTLLNSTLFDLRSYIDLKSFIQTIEFPIVNEAVTICHNAIFYNMGQACCAGSRTYVHSDIYDEFVKKAAAMASKRNLGNPFDSEVMQGPQVCIPEIRTAKLTPDQLIFSLLSRLVSCN